MQRLNCRSWPMSTYPQIPSGGQEAEVVITSERMETPTCFQRHCIWFLVSRNGNDHIVIVTLSNNPVITTLPSSLVKNYYFFHVSRRHLGNSVQPGIGEECYFAVFEVIVVKNPVLVLEHIVDLQIYPGRPSCHFSKQVIVFEVT